MFCSGGSGKGASAGDWGLPSASSGDDGGSTIVLVRNDDYLYLKCTAIVEGSRCAFSSILFCSLLDPTKDEQGLVARGEMS